MSRLYALLFAASLIVSACAPSGEQATPATNHKATPKATKAPEAGQPDTTPATSAPETGADQAAVSADLPTKVAFSKMELAGDGALTLVGWCVSPKQIDKLEVSIDGTVAGNAESGLPRGDVLRNYPDYKNGKSGFKFTQNVDQSLNQVKVAVTAYSGAEAAGQNEIVVKKAQ